MARSAGLIGIATMASRLLGVVREMVLASLFGASATPAMDAFNVAFRVPNLVRDLFAEGAMTAAFVPTFTKTLQTRGREAAWRLGNLVINTLLVVTGAIVVLAIVFADPITHAPAAIAATNRSRLMVHPPSWRMRPWATCAGQQSRQVRARATVALRPKIRDTYLLIRAPVPRISGA